MQLSPLPVSFVLQQKEEETLGPGAIFKSDKVVYVDRWDEASVESENELGSDVDMEEAEEAEEGSGEEDNMEGEEKEEGEEEEKEEEGEGGEEEEEDENEEMTEELRRIQHPSFKMKPEAVTADDVDDEAFDPNKLRAYELNKLKYYYAVIECADVESAATLYSQCDGKEIMVREACGPIPHFFSFKRAISAYVTPLHPSPLHLSCPPTLLTFALSLMT